MVFLVEISLHILGQQPGSVQVMMPGSTPGSVTSTQYSSAPMSADLQSAMEAPVSKISVSLPASGSTDISFVQEVGMHVCVR